MKNETVKYQRIGKRIGEIHRSSMMYFSKEFSKFNIGSGQYMFLLKLYCNEGLTQEELSSQIGLDKTTTARAIKKLEDEGYVERIKRDDDKRAYSIILTEKARNIEKEVYSIMDSLEERFRSCLNENESEELLRLLSKININLV